MAVHRLPSTVHRLCIQWAARRSLPPTGRPPARRSITIDRLPDPTVIRGPGGQSPVFHYLSAGKNDHLKTDQWRKMMACQFHRFIRVGRIEILRSDLVKWGSYSITMIRTVRTAVHLLGVGTVLLALACSPSSTSVPPSTGVTFTYIDPSHSGIDFRNIVEERVDRMYYNFNTIYDGGGVNLGDVNNDGLVDIYFTGNEVDNKLYLNKGGFRFEDITKTAGVAGGDGWKNGATMVDINGDGWLDIYLCRGGWVQDAELRRNQLFVNQGDNTFVEEAANYGLDDRGYSFHACFFDYDNDNWLDVYVINHPQRTGIDIPDYIQGRERGSPYSKDRLYRNQGDGTYTDVTEAAGLSKNFGFGLSISTADLDGNGFVDVYVANDYTEPDYLWMNQGDGTFENRCQTSLSHISLFAMGTDIADVNGDGLEDILVTEMLPADYRRSKTSMASMDADRFYELVDKGFHHQYMHNTLQLNQGAGYFSEIAHMLGLHMSDWSWACYMEDLDNDGDRDIFISNGFRRDVYDKDSAKERQAYLRKHGGKIPDLEEFYALTPSTKTRNTFHQNEGNFVFSNVTEAWGSTMPTFSNGAAVGDLDNDGDLDVVVNNIEDLATLQRNDGPQTGRHYIDIQLVGPVGNRQGFGAKISVQINEKTWMHQVKNTRGYLSTLPNRIHFGLGEAAEVQQITVQWPDGRRNSVAREPANQRITIAHAEAEQDGLASDLSESPPLLEEVTGAIIPAFRHRENDHDDYQYQILLPHRLSRLGPFLSVGDINGDGWDDFFVGGAKGQAGRTYCQSEGGQFVLRQQPSLEQDRDFEDMGSAFFDVDGDGDLDLYVASGGTESLVNQPAYRDRLYLNDGAGRYTRSRGIPDIRISGSCVLPLDYDLDGDTDLFVGGRVLPELYPYPPPSLLLQNDGQGRLLEVGKQVLPNQALLGMVTSAVSDDVDGDGRPDLVLAGEWMPITVLINGGSRFEDRTSDYGLGETSGWWNTIFAVDIDGDGDRDLIGGNAGLNMKYQPSTASPLHVFGGDFDGNNSVDVLLGVEHDNRLLPVRGRECTAEQMPDVAQRFTTYAAFADATLEEVIGGPIAANQVHLQAQTFAHTLFIREQDAYEAAELPPEAQISSLHGIALIGGPGSRPALVMAGNSYHTENETTRLDAGLGMVLQYLDGDIEMLPPRELGTYMRYDVTDLKRVSLANGGRGVLVSSNDDLLRLCVTTRDEALGTK